MGQMVNKTETYAHFSSEVSITTAPLLSPKLPFWQARTARELVVTVIGEEGMLISFLCTSQCKFGMLLQSNTGVTYDYLLYHSCPYCISLGFIMWKHSIYFKPQPCQMQYGWYFVPEIMIQEVALDFSYKTTFFLTQMKISSIWVCFPLTTIHAASFHIGKQHQHCCAA